MQSIARYHVALASEVYHEPVQGVILGKTMVLRDQLRERRVKDMEDGIRERPEIEVEVLIREIVLLLDAQREDWGSVSDNTA